MANNGSREYVRLKAAYSEDMHIAQMANAGITTIPQYLGQLMGEQEWNESVDEANKKFINVDAYEMFKDKASLLLIGRIGTGKSSLLKKMEYDVNNGTISTYKDVVFVNMRDYIRQLASYENLDGTSRTYAEIEENLKNFIMLSIMKHIVYEKREMYPEIVKTIEKFLKGAGITRGTNLGNILDIYADKIKNETAKDILNAINFFSAVTKELFGIDFYEAEEAINEHFKEQKMLVLIDTMPEYDFKDISIVVVVKSLITYVFNNFAENSGVCVKIALPSELYSVLSANIASKYRGNTIFIEWCYRDLVKFIALRCYYLMTESKWKDEFNSLEFSSIKYEDLSFNYDKAKEFLWSLLPKTCSASINLSFDTLSYIIRHTQKKPRQLMTIFESIIHKIITKKDVCYFRKNEAELKRSIHYVQQNLISDCLNMYSNTYDGIVDLCTQILKNRKYCMTAEELEDYINKATWGKARLEKDAIKRVLIESRIIGTYDDGDEHYVDKNNQWFKNPNVIKIIPVLYEYQVKGRLTFNENSMFVVHPMCYEYYKSRIDYNCLVYPECDDESDETFRYITELDD